MRLSASRGLAICAWRQPASGMLLPVLLPVLLPGGRVILHPIVTSANGALQRGI